MHIRNRVALLALGSIVCLGLIALQHVVAADGDTTPCLANTQLAVECEEADFGKQILTAMVVDAAPGTTVTLRLDGREDKTRQRVVDEDGTATVRWRFVRPGEHTVEVVECGLSETVTCSCNLRGTYIGTSSETGARMTASAIPIVRGRLHVAFSADWSVDPDFGFGATKLTPLRGESIRESGRNYRFDLRGYGLNDNHEIVYILVASGIQETQGGCGMISYSGTLSFYGPEQDADGDGIPDAGETPQLCQPDQGTLKRLTFSDDCTPPQP